MRSSNRATGIAKGRYDRISRFYDLSEAIAERFGYSRWRRLLWSKAQGRCLLEIGVGTGKNLPYYPEGADIVAIDFSEKMLRQAQARARRLASGVALMVMDVESLFFSDNTFDSVLASFVFCSVPNPVRGLAEVHRVCKAGGRVVLLEHVRSANVLLGWLMDLANPLVVRLIGANINRRTVENVAKGGLKVEQVTDLWGGIFKLIEARKVAVAEETSGTRPG